MKFYSVQLDDVCVGIFSSLERAQNFMYMFETNFKDMRGDTFYIYEATVDDYNLSKMVQSSPSKNNLYYTLTLFKISGECILLGTFNDFDKVLSYINSIDLHSYDGNDKLSINRGIINEGNPSTFCNYSVSDFY